MVKNSTDTGKIPAYMRKLSLEYGGGGMTKNWRPVLTGKFLTILVLLFSLPNNALFARDVEIIVLDADLGIPLEGTRIRSWDGAEYECDEDGKVLIAVPDDRPVVIQAAYPGYENGRLAINREQSSFTLTLRLGGIMENRELVIEARQPGASETKLGRSVAISGAELARTAEIGIVEDVMSSVKLLPGVGYSGMFNAMPSIRGGDPGDLEAVLDGFYLARPYHWAGGMSIFDPKMIESVKLSHGVFSTRYGHTISGLLEVTSKKPSPTETELDVGLATSAASFNLSYPLFGKGGIMLMGKVTYWDTLVWAAQGISKAVPDNEILGMVDSISVAPYIRSTALSANYRFTTDLELTLNGFFGSDGVGAKYITSYDEDSLLADDGITGRMTMNFDYHNYQGFGIAGINYTPIPKMILRTTLGAGYTELIAEGSVNNDVEVFYTQSFIDKYKDKLIGTNIDRAKIDASHSYHAPDLNAEIDSDNLVFNTQGRVDMDWDLGPALPGFLLAAGVQELYTNWRQYENVGIAGGPMEQLVGEIYAADGLAKGLDELSNLGIAGIPEAAILRPLDKVVDVNNHGLFSSAYTLLEYTTPNQFFGAELGLRMDHLYFAGRDFDVVTKPVWNPRLNLDFTILKNKDLFRIPGFLESLSVTTGTGLFSSMNENISFIEGNNRGLDDMKLNRSWTSVLGTRVDVTGGWSFTIEGYYKYVFDRAHILADLSRNSVDVGWGFDGEGHIGGFDLQLQKLTSRYIDGWISYTFTYARYREPTSSEFGFGGIGEHGGDWYYPSFHRFNNFNLVLNIKPLRQFNIALRFGLASGQPLIKTIYGEVIPYPVQQVTWNEETQKYDPVLDENGNQVIIQKFRRPVIRREETRGPWVLPLDLKFSFFIFNRKGKVQTEIYVGVENLLSLVYKAEETTTYNDYTGKEDKGSSLAAYGFPIPMGSFGFKWSY
ncbi:hypothetical protein AGMMS49942_12620 [Spirochaetia bacterium]|nr:hypothetical protein AGMMS49942_12620 [Spirochaetia bacterium]